MGKDAFGKRKELLARKMSREVKKKIIKTIVWSVTLYGAETWTLRQEDRRRLDAFEMWMWRRMEKISCTEKMINEAVLKTVGEKQRMVEMIIQRKKNWIGHVVRGDGLVKEVIERKMDGKRPREMPQIGMLNELLEGSYQQMKRRAENRSEWRCYVHRICR